MVDAYSVRRLCVDTEGESSDSSSGSGSDRRSRGQAEVAFASHSVAKRGGLRLAREVELHGTEFAATIADVCVSGLPGWVAVVAGPGSGTLRMRLWAPRGVEVYIRPPIPCPTPLGFEHMDMF